MQCPRCGEQGHDARLTVRDTRKEERGVRVARRRVCERNPRHVFDTIEQLSDIRLDGLGVRRASDGTVVDHFSRQRLSRDVRAGVLKRLPEQRLAVVIADVYAYLQDNIRSLYRDVSASATEFDGAIDDESIIDAVEQRLREESHETVYALYVLSTRRGRATRDARAFLDWLRPLPDNAPTSTSTVETLTGRPVDRWFPPGEPPTLPTTVIKRNGERPAFSLPRFRQSIATAFHGRNDAARRSECVTQWVLWGVAGQRTVLTSQLAIGVLDCLRRVDDIAYLRWASIAKNLDYIEQLVSEAEGLVRWPSPRLVFDENFVPYVGPRQAQLRVQSSPDEDMGTPRRAARPGVPTQ